jgi:hypothetical protein
MTCDAFMHVTLSCMFNKTLFEAMQRIHACLVNVQKEIFRAYNMKYRERLVFQEICSNDDLVDMY